MPARTCSIGDCGRPVIARGLCSRCYQRAEAAGELDHYGRQYRTFEESLALAMEAETDEGCWPWPAVHPTNGYPTSVLAAGVRVKAYVASWTALNGPVPDGKTLDHQCHTRSTTCAGGPTCRHRRCVRPDHLTPATRSEQQRWRPSYTSPTCPRGHERTEANTAIQKRSDGSEHRRCRECTKEDGRAYYARKKKERIP